jgi:hypothetical protein
VPRSWDAYAKEKRKERRIDHDGLPFGPREAFWRDELLEEKMWGEADGAERPWGHLIGPFVFSHSKLEESTKLKQWDDMF